jgi:hypothetical protein
MTDGTFNFFRKVDGQWQISDDDYFVDGYLLCTRRKNAGAGNEEHREWWEIESIEDGVMKWKALRQNADGTTYTAFHPELDDDLRLHQLLVDII